MSLLEVLQFVGYATGAVLSLWMGALLLRWRQGLGSLERVLLALAVSIGLWHASNLALTVHSLLGFDRTRWTLLLRAADTLALVSILFSYSLLLHAHLHLWAAARARALTLSERVRVFLSYLPLIFLLVAVPFLWSGAYEPMLAKLAHLRFTNTPQLNYVESFILWAVYVLGLIGTTDLLIARIAGETLEKRFMRTLAASFFAIGVLILSVYVIGIGHGSRAERYLTTIANLGSLLPTALLAHRIYRHRYLELMIRDSLVIATFAGVVLVVYLFGIRVFGEWLTLRYGLRAGVVESLLILALALLVSPLRKLLEKWFHQLFEREATLYREVVARIGTRAPLLQQLPELLRFIEEKTAKVLGLRSVRLIACDEAMRSAEEFEHGLDEAGHNACLSSSGLSSSGLESSGLAAAQVRELIVLSRQRGWRPLEGLPQLKALDCKLVYPLRREDHVAGVMLIDAPRDALTHDVRAVLEVLAGQVCIAIDDCRLVEENVKLERKVAHGERLAALGQMAATVAHEVKNPLSAIKSIAQVMREDERLLEYDRDLSLIVGETDRLSGSITQLLSFARRAPETLEPCSARDLIHSIVELFRAQAAAQRINLECDFETRAQLSGVLASTLRDAVSNLLLNALQATPPGGHVRVEGESFGSTLTIKVEDTGAGVPRELRERMWEPFFTTKQRGTGLGLAIVRKRLEEAGGQASLMASPAGACFVLRVPLEESV